MDVNPLDEILNENDTLIGDSGIAVTGELMEHVIQKQLCRPPQSKIAGYTAVIMYDNKYF